MKNKKIIMPFIILFIIILIGGFFAIKFIKNRTNGRLEEYTPEEEITDDQLRQTIVSLYFQNKETKEINPEARLVDIKELINNPYEKIMLLLIEGPKNEKNEKIIPEGTKVLKSYMEEDCLVLDLSLEFLNYDKNDEKIKKNIIKSIVNSMTELAEVNKIKIIINGNDNNEFNEIYTREK